MPELATAAEPILDISELLVRRMGTAYRLHQQRELEAKDAEAAVDYLVKKEVLDHD